ncbi:MAG: hypothetical protein ACHQAX_08150 [Gammaproteobacteria bacterium]
MCRWRDDAGFANSLGLGNGPAAMDTMVGHPGEISSAGLATQVEAMGLAHKTVTWQK